MIPAARHTVAAIAIAVVALAHPALAYSVLTHESVVDSAWTDAVVPLLRARFPRETTERLMRARAYAYGGAVIQDLGYFPFGSRRFTNLIHYVRSGDFVQALIGDAKDVDEYAFALGALAHYASDNVGHPVAVNRVVPLVYPKLRGTFGDEVLYVDSPKRHVMVEFAFDVLQVARGGYALQTYHDFIGFEVAKPLLERVFTRIYGLEMKDLFLSEDLAIGTYRYAVSKTIPEMTRLAWREHRDEIEKVTPGVQGAAFIYRFDRASYEKEFGDTYRRPGLVSRVLAFIIKIVPKVGPLSVLAFRPLTPEAERLFLESTARTRERYRTLLRSAAGRRLTLPDTDFDVGKAPMRGENALADATYDDLLKSHAAKTFADAPTELREALVRYYASATEKSLTLGKDPDDARALRQDIDALNAARRASR